MTASLNHRLAPWMPEEGMAMTLDDARVIVRDCVAQHGPERAKRLLSDRCETDAEFNRAVVLHGATIMDALIDSMGATRH